MKEILSVLLFMHKVVIIIWITPESFPLGTKTSLKLAYILGFVISFICWVFTITIMIPTMIWKILTKSITNEDANESLEDLNKHLITREGLSEFEWRNCEQILKVLETRNKIPENFLELNTLRRKKAILFDCLICSKTGLSEMRLETKEEYISKFKETSVSFSDEINQTLAKAAFDKIISDFPHDEMQQIQLGREYVFRKKNSGGKKSTPPSRFLKMIPGF